VLDDKPVSALYEQGSVHHVGPFQQLEDQMCSWTPDMDRDAFGSPDRVDALVWALTELMVDETEIKPLFTSVSLYNRTRAMNHYDLVHGWS
jgi:phage terminase large subunit-like protein